MLELAHLHIAGGQPDRARALLADVRAIAEGLDAAPTLARVAALEQRLSSGLPAYPAGLTAREVDVLRLVARGMSDAEVAERLFISPRTVGSHLTSIYTKLDVGSRTAAAAAARDYGIA